MYVFIVLLLLTQIPSTVDGVPVDKEIVYISYALFAVYTVISSLGILFALGILIFNLIYAKTRLLQSLYGPLIFMVSIQT